MSVEFLKSEYLYCTEKMNQSVDHLVKVEVYTLFALGVTYAWIFTSFQGSKIEETHGYVVWLPLIISLLAWYRHVMQLRYMTTLNAFIKILEKQALGQEAPQLGWEHYYAKHGPTKTNIGYLWLLFPTMSLIGLYIGWSS